MAGLLCQVDFSNFSPAAATERCAVLITAPANQRLRLRRVVIKTNGTSGTDAAVDVVIRRCSSAGTMTGATPRRLQAGFDETPQATASVNATANPTTGDTVFRAGFHPQATFDERIAPNEPIDVEGGGRLGVFITSAAALTFAGCLIYEE